MSTARKVATRKVMLQTELQKRGIYNNLQATREFLIGRTVLVRNNQSSGHQYGIGSKLKIDDQCVINVSSMSGLINISNPSGFGGGTIYFTEVELCAGSAEFYKKEIKDIDKRIAALKAEQADTTERLAFLEETEAEELDEPQYKKWVLKKVFSSKMTEDEKISKLAELLFD